MLFALKYPQHVKKLVSVDIAPINYPSIASFQNYVNWMKEINLATLTTRREADLHLQTYLAVRHFNTMLLLCLNSIPKSTTISSNLNFANFSLPILFPRNLPTEKQNGVGHATSMRLVNTWRMYEISTRSKKFPTTNFLETHYLQAAQRVTTSPMMPSR